MELLKQVELARRMGISRQSIGRALKKNKLRLVGSGRDTKIDWHDELTQKYVRDHNSNRQVANEMKQEAGQSPATPNDSAGESTQLRDEKLKIQTQKLRMEMAERMGELVLRSEVEKVFGKVSTAIRSYIFPISDRVSPMLAGIFESTDPEKIKEIKLLIDKEIGRAIESVKTDIINSLTEIK